MVNNTSSPVRHRSTHSGWFKWRFLALVCLVLAVILGLSGTVGWVVCRQIESQIDARNYDQAASLVSWMQWTGSCRAEIAFWEGRLHRKQSQGTEAIKCLVAARSAGFDRERVRRELILLHAQAGNLSPILSDLQAMLSAPLKDGAEICEAFVNGALVDGHVELALTVIEAWQDTFPSDPRPLYFRGRLFEYRQDPVSAEREYQKALELDGQHWQSRYALGRLLLNQKKATEALSQFRVASQVKENVAPRLQMAKCLRALGKNDEARAILIDLLKHSPRDVNKSFSRMVDPQPGLPVETELGLLESSLQNWPEALLWLQRAAKSDSQVLEARYALAVALRSLGRADEAQLEFEAVRQMREAISEADRLADKIAQQPGSSVAERCRIGELFMKNDNRRRGEFWLRSALQRDPNYGPAHQLLAEYYGELAMSDPAYAEPATRHQQAAQAASQREASQKSLVQEQKKP